MAYSELLAQRVRDALAGQAGVTEKKMFGGIAFMLQGNMCCGVMKDELMVRVGPEAHAGAMAQPNTREFAMSGRPMPGWILVTPDGVATDEGLRDWVQRGVDFARSLPAK